jgi:hypothetical protein
MAYQAQETFTASPDGIPVLVQRGQVFPDKHWLVKLDDGRGLLVKPLDLDQPPPDAKPPKTAPGLEHKPPARGKGD